MNKPTDSQTTIEGIHYKVGRFGYVYRWNGVEWVRSTRSKEELLRSTNLLQPLEKHIYAAIEKHGPITRKRLAEVTGYNKNTLSVRITNLLNKLHITYTREKVKEDGRTVAQLVVM